MPLMRLVEIYLRIRPDAFHYLKFILEGYDGLAQLSSVENRKGLVRLRFPREQSKELFQLIAALAPRLRPELL
jgi:hypothetical protein